MSLLDWKSILKSRTSPGLLGHSLHMSQPLGRVFLIWSGGQHTCFRCGEAGWMCRHVLPPHRTSPACVGFFILDSVLIAQTRSDRTMQHKHAGSASSCVRHTAYNPGMCVCVHTRAETPPLPPALRLAQRSDNAGDRPRAPLLRCSRRSGMLSSQEQNFHWKITPLRWKCYRSDARSENAGTCPGKTRGQSWESVPVPRGHLLKWNSFYTCQNPEGRL